MIKAYMQRRHEEEGFTLIELMVVVLIIGILIAIALPTFLGARARSQDRAAQSDLRNAIAAGKTYFTDGDTYAGFYAQAAAIEPSLQWVDGTGGATAAVVGKVTVDVATLTTLTMSEGSASGKFFCISDNTTSGTKEGNVDAKVGTACTGTW